MNNPSALSQLRRAFTLHIDQSPEQIRVRRPASSDPFAGTVETVIRGRISHERRGPMSTSEGPTGLDTNLGRFLQWEHDKAFFEDDLISAQGRLFKVGSVDPIRKFGGVHCYQAPLTAAGLSSDWVNSVSLNGADPVSMAPGDDFQLVAAVLPTTAKNQTVLWVSSDEDVATVDGDGLVTAVSDGSATITATTHDGGFTAQRDFEILTP